MIPHWTRSLRLDMSDHSAEEMRSSWPLQIGLAELDPWTLGWRQCSAASDHPFHHPGPRELLLELLEGHQDWIAFFPAFEPHLAVACQNPSAEAISFGRTGLQGALAMPQHMVVSLRELVVAEDIAGMESWCEITK